MTTFWIETASGPKAHELTPTDYHEAIVRDTMDEYKCSRIDAQACHPRLATDQDHLNACRDFVNKGGELSEAVLDALPIRLRNSILHDWPNQHQTYLPPSVRATEEGRVF